MPEFIMKPKVTCDYPNRRGGAGLDSLPSLDLPMSRAQKATHLIKVTKIGTFS